MKSIYSRRVTGNAMRNTAAAKDEQTQISEADLAGRRHTAGAVEYELRCAAEEGHEAKT